MPATTDADLIAALRALADHATTVADLLTSRFAAADDSTDSPPPPAPASPALAESRPCQPPPAAAPRVDRSRSGPGGPLDGDMVAQVLAAHGRPCAPGDLVAAVTERTGTATTPQAVFWALKRIEKAGRAVLHAGRWSAGGTPTPPQQDPPPPATSSSVPAPPAAASIDPDPAGAPSTAGSSHGGGGARPSRSQLPPVESSHLDRWKLLDLVITYGDDAAGLAPSAIMTLLPWGVSSRLESSYDVLQVLQSLERDGLVRVRRGRWQPTEAGHAADAERQGQQALIAAAAAADDDDG